MNSDVNTSFLGRRPTTTHYEQQQQQQQFNRAGSTSTGTMNLLRKSVSYNLRQARQELSAFWASYQPVNQGTKVVEHAYKNEIQQLIKDIEDPTKSDTEAWQRYENQSFGDDFKQKIRDLKIGQNEYSILHLAAKSCRPSFCRFLLDEIEIDKDTRCKDTLTPLHLLVKSNVFYEQDCRNNENEALRERIQAFQETFDLLIVNNTDYNAQDDFGSTCLHYAAARNNYLAVKMLLDLPDIDVSPEDKKFFTPLHLTCKFGHSECAIMLIERLDLDRLFYTCVSDDVPTPLHLVCRNKNEKLAIAKAILERLAEAGKQRKQYQQQQQQQSPQQQNTSSNFYNFVEFALKKEDQNRQTILNMAVENNHLHIVEMLLRDYDYNREHRDGKFGNLPIHLVAKSGSIEMFNLLKRYDCVSFKVNANSENALHIAAYYNKYKFIREFRTYEATMLGLRHHPNCGGLGGSLELGSQYMPCMCHCEIDTQLHVRSEKQRDRNYYTPLMCAVEAGNQKCVHELLADIDGVVMGEQQDAASRRDELHARDKDGNTVYHVAAEAENVDSLRHLFQLDESRDEVIFSRNNFDDSILHVACRNGNLEVIKLIVNRLYDSNLPIDQVLYAKNRDGFTCFHLACCRGYHNLVEYFLKERKLNAYLDHFDLASNTALHLATEHGHASIVNILLEHGIDVCAKNEANMTALDVSCRKGYFEISKTIINNYSSFNKNDRLNEFPLHTACYEGAYEVVRLLLQKGSKIDQLNNRNENCLDIAIAAGHRDVIRVLLDDPNWYKLIRLNNRVTALYEDEDVDDTSADDSVDVTLHKGEKFSGKKHHRTTKSKRRHSQSSSLRLKIVSASKSLVGGPGGVSSSGTIVMGGEKQKFVENPELTAIYDAKMWDIFKIILDKCIGDDEINFTIIDPPVRSISRHPLMLIARSGQENLLKHETTRTLLHLKWRLIPRFAFWFNLIFYLLFLFLFSFYSNELAIVGRKMLDDAPPALLNSAARAAASARSLSSSELDHIANRTYNFTRINFRNMFANETTTSMARENEQLRSEIYKNTTYYQMFAFKFHKQSNAYIVLVCLLNFQMFKELSQIVFIDGLAYFLSLQNLLELFTYSTALISLFANSYYIQSAYGSVAILCAFIAFPLYIQKLKIFGLYVVAFRRTLANSAKFFPIFLFIFTGFILSYRIRSNFGVTYFNSTGYSIIRTLTMVVGELDTAKMGLNSHDSLPNYFIYFMFIGLMCTIVLNLFVGIAVGEIKTVLGEADIQQTSMRIMFVLKIQSALYLFRKTCLRRFLNMSFSKYSLQTDTRLTQLKNKVWRMLNQSRENTIKLSDPQKRLEEAFFEMARSTRDEIKSIRYGFSQQVVEIEGRLSNSNRRLQDSILELSGRTLDLIDEFKADQKTQAAEMRDRLERTQRRLEALIDEQTQKTNEEFKYTNNFFNNHLKSTEERITDLNTRIQTLLLNLTKKQTFQFESMKGCSMTGTRHLKTIIIGSLKSLEDSFMELERTNKLQLETAERVFASRLESIDTRLVDSLQTALGELNSRVRALNELKLLNESLIYNVNGSIAELSFKLDKFAREHHAATASTPHTSSST